jgi:ketosteroid isomerase-like protein
MTDSSILDQLNRDIWHPFRRTYRTGDLHGFLGLYHPDLIRAGGPTKEVYGFDRLAAETADWFTEVSARGDSLDIEFRFTERIAAGELASEQGCYRITATRADANDGEHRTLHGRFHTFARKVGGRWRIVVDYDTDDGGAITAAMFAAGAGVEDTARF